MNTEYTKMIHGSVQVVQKICGGTCTQNAINCVSVCLFPSIAVAHHNDYFSSKTNRSTIDFDSRASNLYVYVDHDGIVIIVSIVCRVNSIEFDASFIQEYMHAHNQPYNCIWIARRLHFISSECTM